jgi:phage shock protein C
MLRPDDWRSKHMADQPRRLERDPDNKMIAGVAAGVANYFDMDPTLVRVLWALTLLLGGFGAVVYIIMWIVVPEGSTTPASTSEPGQADAAPAATPPAAAAEASGAVDEAADADDASAPAADSTETDGSAAADDTAPNGSDDPGAG